MHSNDIFAQILSGLFLILVIGMLWIARSPELTQKVTSSTLYTKSRPFLFAALSILAVVSVIFKRLNIFSAVVAYSSVLLLLIGIMNLRKGKKK